MHNVLIVDDEEAVRKGLEIVIDWGENGFSIKDSVTNGAEAIDLINKYNYYDVIITDVRMPKVDGIELTKYIYENNLNIKVIIISAYREFEYAQAAVLYRVKNYILKPIDEDILVDTLQKVKNEIEEENKSRLREKESIKDKLFDDLIFSKVKKDDIVYKAVQSGIKLNKNELCTCIIESPSFTGDLYNDITNNINSLLKTYECEYFCKNRYGFLILVLGYNSDFNLKEIIIQIFNIIKEFMAYDFVMAVGKAVNSYEDLFISYQCAHEILGYQLVMGNKNIIFYDEFNESRSECNTKADWNYEKLIKSVKEYRLKDSETEIDGFISYILHNKFQDNIVYSLFTDITLKLEKLLQEYCIDESINYNGEIKEIYQKKTLLELKSYLAGICYSTGKKIDLDLRDNSKWIINDIKEFIYNNSNQELSIKEIARKFNYNPAYLGRLFKNSTEVNVRDYLNYCRIEKAAQLILETDMKVYEVSETVGYKDLNYFIKTFKRYKFCTPYECKSRKKYESG